MRVVFMGTPDFAVPSLVALADEHDVVAVYTRPDAVSGRGSMTRPSPVKCAATELGLTVEQPATLRDPATRNAVAAYAPDVCVVAAYGLILPPDVLAIPPHGCVNVHASLLPRWRGAAPVQRAILAGDAATGVSIMRMEEGLDTGPYCAVETVEIGEKNADELTRELAAAGARALVRALHSLESGTCQWQAQDEASVTYAAKLTKPEVALSPELTVQESLKRVRASSAQAPARARIVGKGVTLLRARESAQLVEQGRITAHREGIVLGVSDGALLVESVRPDGKRDMVACDWARGLKLDADSEWARA